MKSSRTRKSAESVDQELHTTSFSSDMKIQARTFMVAGSIILLHRIGIE